MKHTPQQIEETREFLKKYNGWRRSDEEREMPHPRDIGVHIERAIDILGEIRESEGTNENRR